MNEKVRLQVLKNDTEHTYGDVGNKAGDEYVPTSVKDSALPSGAATSAKQDTGNTSLASLVTGQLPDGHEVEVNNLPLSQKVMDESLPVVIASDQTAVPMNLAQYSGAEVGADNPLDVSVVAPNPLPVSLESGAVIGPADPVIDSYTHLPINLSAGANQVLVASAASKQIWVYGIGFTLSVAGSVSFQDEDDTAITGIMPFYANSGLGIPASGNFAMPIWKLATNKDLEVDLVTADMDGWLDYAIVSV